jgi:RNA polymerase sigma factor (TIGR02999 family)
MANPTQLIEAAVAGDAQAAAELLPLVYGELRTLAAARLAAEKPGQTLQATALVHEVYLRLIGSDPAKPWAGRGQFFAAAAEAMRRIVIDRARSRNSLRRGGGRRRVPIDDLDLAAPEPDEQAMALDEALTRFQTIDPLKAELVKLRYFAGLTTAEVADVLGISVASADRYWAYARSWLHAEVKAADPPTESDGKKK